MSGLTRLSKRQNGPATKRRCCFISPKFSQRCGVRLPNSLVAQRSSALRSMRNCSTSHKVEIQTTQTLLVRDLPVRSIPIRRQSLQGLTRSTWTKTRKRCFRSVEPALQTLKVRKLLVRSARRNSKKHVGLPNCKSSESSSKLVSTFIGRSRSRASITTKRCLSWPRCLKAGTRWALKRRLRLMSSNQTRLLSKLRQS